MGITVHRDDIDITGMTLLEGLPGLGLAGKIAGDHLIEALEMAPYATVATEGIPRMTLFDADTYEVRPPVRLFVAPDAEIVLLRSDVLISPEYAPAFPEMLVEFAADHDLTPLLTAGLPTQGPEHHDLFGVATGDAGGRLEQHGIARPDGTGFLSGVTGALLHALATRGVDALGLLVEADAQFPDPAAARVLLEDGIEPLTGIDVDTAVLSERADEIRQQKEQLAEMIREAEQHERSGAVPDEWYG